MKVTEHRWRPVAMLIFLAFSLLAEPAAVLRAIVVTA